MGPGIINLLSKVVGFGGTIIDQLVPDKDLNAKLKSGFETIVENNRAELDKLGLQAYTDEQAEIEATHRAALGQSDLKTKRTRPDIARSSWRLAWWYLVATIGSQVLSTFIEALSRIWVEALDVPSVAFDPIIFGTVSGPALWYMGMRAIDKYKNGGNA